MFSRHTAWTSGPGPLDRALASLPASEILDLTVSNPTTAGFTHPPDFYRRLCDERSALYEPASLGLASAREAVAGYYAARGRPPDPADIGVCASSSEAYAFILGLLCDPGDVVLVPQPGYPLLRILAELAHVELISYPLAYDGGWYIDLAALEHILVITPRARALVVVAPNNPTGNYLAPHELDALTSLLAPRNIAVVVDEVFWDYPLTSSPRSSPTLTPPACLGFVISGLSKVAALPQLKLAWWLALGPARLVREAMARLELIADTYLSAATPVQLALPELLATAPATRTRISRRTHANLLHLRRTCIDTAMTVLAVDAGWTALLRMPAVLDHPDGGDAGWALELLTRGHLLTQPGHLYDLHGPPHLALSLLTPEPVFSPACDRLRMIVADVLAL